MLKTVIIFTLILELFLIMDYVFNRGKFFLLENKKLLGQAMFICAIPFINAAIILMILFSKTRS